MTITCPYCSTPAVYTDSSVIYGKSYGMIYLCKPCSAWVGVHRGTSTPLGRLANEELRKWKSTAHTYFDQLWKRKKGKRGRDLAYAWLSKEMDLDPKDTHIGMFDVEQCKQVVALCKPYLLTTHPTTQ